MELNDQSEFESEDVFSFEEVMDNMKDNNNGHASLVSRSVDQRRVSCDRQRSCDEGGDQRPPSCDRQRSCDEGGDGLSLEETVCECDACLLGFDDTQPDGLTRQSSVREKSVRICIQ